MKTLTLVGDSDAIVFAGCGVDIRHVFYLPVLFKLIVIRIRSEYENGFCGLIVTIDQVM